MKLNLRLAARVATRKLFLWTKRYRLPRRLRRHIPSGLAEFYGRVVDTGSVYKVLGSWMYIPPPERRPLLLKGVYEPPVAALLSRLLAEGLTFCDVGANMGVFTLLGARLVGVRGLVIAIEPIPEIAAVLRNNVALNGYQNVRVLQKAVDERPGAATIHLSKAYGCHSVFPNPYSATGWKIEIQSLRLDSLPQMPQTSVLKIDTEGAELSVLKSLGNIRPPDVILEYNSERQQAAGISGLRFLEALREFGYRKIVDLDDPTQGLQRICKGDSLSHNLHLHLD